MENASTLPALNVTELVNIVNEAPGILEKNTISRDNAVSYGEKLVAQAENHGMTDDLDQIMSSYLEKLRVTYKSITERRKPFTQIVDEIKKRFTTLEADISPTGKENIFAHVQGWRNQYATVKIEEQKRKEREAAERLAREKELVNIRLLCEEQYASHFNGILTSAKRELIGIFESMTLDNEDTARNRIAMFPASLDADEFYGYVPRKNLVYAGKEQFETIAEEVATGMYPEFNLEYASQINVLKKELIDKVASKVDELKRIAMASAEEAKRLRDDAELRRKESEERAAREASEASKRASDEAAARAAAASLQATIDSAVDVATDAPKVKEGYEILIKNPVAYSLIFQFWFEKEGRDWPVEKIEKMTIGRMKTFCENWAIKNDEKISSNLIQYREIFKAK
jgi:nicotinamide mononucleotide adenylyltransferase